MSIHPPPLLARSRSNNAALLPVAAKAAEKRNKDVFNLVGPNLLLEEDAVPGKVTHFWPL